MIRLLWRSHAHVWVTARVPEDRWSDLFDAVAEAAHKLDEEVTCGGGLRDPSWGIAAIEVTGYRMRRAAVDALAGRVREAARTVQPKETAVSVVPRCRCA